MTRALAPPIATRRRSLVRPLLLASLCAVLLLGTGILGGYFGFFHVNLDAAVKLQDANSEAKEQIPRIIHQTWKTDVLPERWQQVQRRCVEMHPNYTYILWSDSDARKLIQREYAWFLPTYDGYPYNIQRADAIRYFVLHHYGGIYMDIDIGCLRPMDALLPYQVVLPATMPVGVSNDLLLSVPRHPFFRSVIDSLQTFDHRYLTHYPTVMFSTGPMFLSAMYSLWVQRHGLDYGGVRILPRALYGKHLPTRQSEEGMAPFFEHFYGSSWHSSDAGLVLSLARAGKWAAFALLLLGVTRWLLTPRATSQDDLEKQRR